MKREVEVELKYNVLDPIVINKLDIQVVGKRRVVDVYYDTTKGELFKRGIFIRNRNANKLDFKFNFEDIAGKSFKNDHTHCDEYSFDLPLSAEDKERFHKVCSILDIDAPGNLSLSEFLKANGYVELVVVDKERTVAKKNGFDISIDEVEDLGVFLEVERLLEIEAGEDNYEVMLDDLKQKIDTFVQSLGLNVEQNMTGYCELILLKTNFELYKQGKYVLEEDI
ncbi:MAG: CYTH domain-containing protein [Patescibacteria group bacterium]|nr:CYTH domain-containing protein [Patescibacteria group bacterium]